MQLPIVIIGPLCSGKTTISKLLSKRLLLQRYPLDSIRWYYYHKNGIDLNKDDELRKSDFEDLLKFRREHDFYAVKSALREFKDGILEFGASHSYWEDVNMLRDIKHELKNISNVFLLIPDRDKRKSINILNARLAKREKVDDLDILQKINEKMILCKSNYNLPKIIIYTDGKKEVDIVNEIVSNLK